MTNVYTKEAMRARFWELTDAKDALNETLKPYREARNEIRDALRAPVASYKEAKLAVVAIERPRMAEIDMEMAVLARALGNKIGLRQLKS